MRPLTILDVLVHSDSLWRVSWTKPPCFCWGERFILRGRGFLPLGGDPLLVDVPFNPAMMTALLMACSAPYQGGGGTQGGWYTYPGVLGRHIWEDVHPTMVPGRHKGGIIPTRVPLFQGKTGRNTTRMPLFQGKTGRNTHQGASFLGRNREEYPPGCLSPKVKPGGIPTRVPLP